MLQTRARLSAIVVAGASLFVAAPAAAPAQATTQAPASALQQDVDAFRDAGAVGVLAETVAGSQSTKARAGERKLGTGQPVAWNTRFRTGSITKTYVAATTLKLVAAGKLSLDDTVERWLPGVIRGNGNDGRTITVRQLLNHTSGLFNYTDDAGFIGTLDTAEAFRANWYRHYSPRQLIGIALSHPPNFAPGTDWSYSNTGYVVMGEIIKAATGNRWDREVEKRILRPLGLSDTTVPGDNPLLPWPFAHGYHVYTTDPATRRYTDTTLHNMTWGGAAGAMISTTADHNRFFRQLMKGGVLAPAQLAEMKTVVELGEGIGYGLGLLRMPLSCDDHYWSHSGGVVGFSTEAAVSDDGSRSLALMVSTTTFTDAELSDGIYGATIALEDRFFCAATERSIAARSAPDRAAAKVRAQIRF